jgi:hypothetical protein
MDAMFTAEERARLRESLLERAAGDPRISGGAITGSVAAGAEDAWSDIDLAFGVSDGAELAAVLDDWTDHMYQRQGALHHVDVRAGVWIYRVFLLRGTLQVDLAFAPAAEFRALAPAFRLVFGKANEPAHGSPPPAESLIGMAWLYALHARTSIARGKRWQAVYMINGVRDHALMLAALRHGLPTAHGRGLHGLPAEVSAAFEDSLVRQLDAAELSRAFRATLGSLLQEIRHADPKLAVLLDQPLRQLFGSV